MRKYICIILVFVTALATVGAACYRWGFNNSREKAAYTDVPEENIAEALCKVDYPLIDIAFNDGNDYAVVIINGIYDENREYFLCGSPGELQEHLWVNTYPAGRGTTGQSAVIVYRNGQEAKCLECFEIGFGSKEFEEKFEKISVRDFVRFVQEGSYE